MDRPLWRKLQWIRDPFGFMREAAARYGDCFTTPLGDGSAPIVFCSDPSSLETLLAHDNGELFDAPGELNALFEPLLGTESVIAISDRRHRRMRQLLMPPFHGERMRAYGDTILGLTRDLIASWSPGQRIAVHTAMQTISMRVILSTVFGLGEGERYRRMERELASLLDGMSRPLSVCLLYFPALRLDVGPASPWGRFLRARASIDAMLHAEIEERRRHPDPSRSDILSMLLAARDEQGKPLSDAELRDELMTLLMAGHETTATALSWALHWVLRNPVVLERLRTESESAGDDPEPAAIARLPYLQAVCSETLRIYPVGMLTFARRTRQPVEMAGYLLPAGTVVTGSIFLAHRRPEVYPDPERFDPDRFLNRSFSPWEFLPFGGGVRRCIGMALAQYEMKLVLHTLLRSVPLRLTDASCARPVRRGLTSGISPVSVEVGR